MPEVTYITIAGSSERLNGTYRLTDFEKQIYVKSNDSTIYLIYTNSLMPLANTNGYQIFQIKDGRGKVPAYTYLGIAPNCTRTNLVNNTVIWKPVLPNTSGENTFGTETFEEYSSSSSSSSSSIDSSSSSSSSSSEQYSSSSSSSSSEQYSSSSSSSSSMDSSSSSSISSSSSSSIDSSSSSSSSSSIDSSSSSSAIMFRFYAMDVNNQTLAVDVRNGSVAGTFDFWVLDENQIDSLQVSVVDGVIDGTFGFWAVDGDSNTIHITVTDGVVELL
jgi:hypothetical protein